MRYRRQRLNPLTLIARLFLFGIIAGIAYYVVDNWQPGASATVIPTDIPTLIPPTPMPTAIAATPEPTLEPTTLFIPTAGVSAHIVEAYLDGTSWDVRQLGENAGHLQGTAWIDQPGNIVLAGHVELTDGRAGIFGNLDELHRGDPIIITHGSDQRRYTVTHVRLVEDNDMSVLYPTTTDQLTLITCSDYDFVQNRYRQRVVVVAEREV